MYASDCGWWCSTALLHFLAGNDAGQLLPCSCASWQRGRFPTGWADNGDSLTRSAGARHADLALLYCVYRAGLVVVKNPKQLEQAQRNQWAVLLAPAPQKPAKAA